MNGMIYLETDNTLVKNMFYIFLLFLFLIRKTSFYSYNIFTLNEIIIKHFSKYLSAYQTNCKSIAHIFHSKQTYFKFQTAKDDTLVAGSSNTRERKPLFALRLRTSRANLFEQTENKQHSICCFSLMTFCLIFRALAKSRRRTCEKNPSCSTEVKDPRSTIHMLPTFFFAHCDHRHADDA
jgi:hypothetical protein